MEEHDRDRRRCRLGRKRDIGASACYNHCARQANQYFLDEARQRQQSYSPAEHRDYVDQIIRAYSAAHFERVRGWGLDNAFPVFVLGLPRSY